MLIKQMEQKKEEYLFKILNRILDIYKIEETEERKADIVMLDLINIRVGK